MSDELARRIQERLPGLPLTYSTRRKLRAVATGAGVAIFADEARAKVEQSQLKTDAAVAAAAMKHTAELVDQMRELAGDDPLKAAALLPIVQRFVARAKRDERATSSLLDW